MPTWQGAEFAAHVSPHARSLWLTLITAFGIAIVKAYLVAKNFMHLNIEPRYAVYLLCTVLAFILLFFAGTAPDVMKHEGSHWVKTVVEVKNPAPEHH